MTQDTKIEAVGHTAAIVARMVADINASRHFGLAAHERMRRDTKLARLQDQRSDRDVSSALALTEYWRDPEAHRQQRIICLIAARKQQLQQFPASFHYWMLKASDCRRREMELRTSQAPKPVSVTQVADMVCGHIMASQRVA